MTRIDEITAEHLGRDATDEDVAVFRGAAKAYMCEECGIDEKGAIDYLWSRGAWTDRVEGGHCHACHRVTGEYQSHREYCRGAMPIFDAAAVRRDGGSIRRYRIADRPDDEAREMGGVTYGRDCPICNQPMRDGALYADFDGDWWCELDLAVEYPLQEDTP